MYLLLFMSFTELSQVLNKRFKDSSLGKNVQATLVCEEFNKIIKNICGENITNKAQALYVKNKMLTVACLSSTVASEIKMRQDQIISKLEDKFGKGVVEDIRIVT